ncbi:MAG: hypothetical protein QM532_04185, partial [Cyanobium sp. MAG06]|nr:hypothetical protein [Cyanobium sp. MAG06]
IKNKISDQNFNNIEFIFVDKNTDIELEGVSIKVFKQLHQKEIHLMFFIKINNISISHIVDAKLNNNNCNNDFED